MAKKISARQLTAIQQWASALASGQYTQTHQVMRSEDGLRFCCLGVACDLFDPKGWYTVNGLYAHQAGSTCIGLRHWDDWFGNFILPAKPTKWNDKDKLTFDEIAKEILAAAAKCEVVNAGSNT